MILIVEHDSEVRTLLRDDLHDFGLPIQETADGDEAPRMVLDVRPLLILTDLRMPAGTQTTSPEYERLFTERRLSL